MNSLVKREKFTFSDAQRVASHVCVGLAGLPGAGKTNSAFRLAQGLTGGEGIFVVDADNNRTTQYSDRFRFKHLLLRAPFRPIRFLHAMQDAVDAGARCIIVDPISNAWEGDGGYLDMVEDETERMAGDDFAKRERVKFTARIKPKAEWKAMCRWLEQAQCNLILCFRAHPKVQISKDNRGKAVVGDAEWTPISEPRLASFATINLMLRPGGQGRPDLDEANTKLDVHAFGFIKSQEQITEDTGEALGLWARGEVIQPSKGARRGDTARRVENKAEAPPPAQPADAITDAERAADIALLGNDTPTDDKHILGLRRFIIDLLGIASPEDYQRVVMGAKMQQYLARLSTSPRKHLYEHVAPLILAAQQRAGMGVE